MKDTVCIYSGGMDSFTLVNEIARADRLHSCLSFNYGQRHSKELRYAARGAAHLGVPHHVIDLTALAPHLLGSALTDSASVQLPEGHYANDNMKLTVVPNRNMIMLSVAIAYAVSHKLLRVCYGAHGGDHTIYPDCRPEFVELMHAAALIANWHPVAVEAPYLKLDKAAILKIGYRLGLDYRDAWTCYAGGQYACGRCGSCRERLEAFQLIGKEDPLQYEGEESAA